MSRNNEEKVFENKTKQNETKQKECPFVGEKDEIKNRKNVKLEENDQSMFRMNFDSLYYTSSVISWPGVRASVFYKS